MSEIKRGRNNGDKEPEDRIELVDQALHVLEQEIVAGTDRSLVLVGTAIVDDELRRLLEQFLLPKLEKQSGRDELLEGDRPIGTLSARTKLASRLGLIDREISQSIDVLRSIRNAFAHIVTAGSFENPKNSCRIKSLVDVFRSGEHYDRLYGPFENCPPLRREFAAVLGCILIGISKGFARPALAQSYPPPPRGVMAEDNVKKPWSGGEV